MFILNDHTLLFRLLTLFVLGVPFSTLAAEVKNEEGEINQKDIAEELVSLNFAEAIDIKDFAVEIMRWTGKNMILDNRVTGKIQILSTEKMTQKEAYEAFLASLKLLDFTTIESGKVIKIIKMGEAQKGFAPISDNAKDIKKSDLVTTFVKHLKNANAKEVKIILLKLLQTNSVEAYEPTNSIFISDTGYNLKRAINFIDFVDIKPAEKDLKIIVLKYAPAKQLADKIAEIFKQEKNSKFKTLNYKLLWDDNSNSLFYYGSESAYKIISEVVQALDRQEGDFSFEKKIFMRPLEYSDSKKMATMLDSLKINSSSAKNQNKKQQDQIKITPEEGTNSLLISATKKNFQELNRIIRRLDLHKGQILLEADILDINEDHGYTFGSSLLTADATGGKKNYKVITGWQGAAATPLIIAGAQNGAEQSGALNSSLAKNMVDSFSSDMTIGVLGAGSINLPGVGNFTPAGLIKLVKGDSFTRVLSSPYVLGVDNEEASITVGETVYYRTMQSNTFPSDNKDKQVVVNVPKVEKENVDLTLTVKPSISLSSNLSIELTLESNSVISETEEGIPRLAKKKIKQQVIVKDGQTIVISGLKKEEQLDAEKKIPILGDLPILGGLFKNSIKVRKTNNLVIFLTPHIVYGAADLAKIYQRKKLESEQLFPREIDANPNVSEKSSETNEDDGGNYKPTQEDLLESKFLERRRQEAYKASGYETPPQ